MAIIKKCPECGSDEFFIEPMSQSGYDWSFTLICANMDDCDYEVRDRKGLTMVYCHRCKSWNEGFYHNCTGQYAR